MVFKLTLSRTTFLFSLLLLLVFPDSLSSIPFTPHLRNFSLSEYQAGNQNWAISQDSKGYIYVGNNRGLLVYNGNQWQIYHLGNNYPVRSVYVAQDDKIYVGSFEEFGYFFRDNYNQLKYVSLKEQVDNFDFHNDEIWSIQTLDGKVYFQSFSSYFIYDKEQVKGVKTGWQPLNFMKVTNKIFSQEINGGLNLFKDPVFEQIIPRSSLGNDDVVAILPYGPDYLLVTRNNGMFLYSDSDKTVHVFKTEADSDLYKYSVNKAIVSTDSCYVLGTLSNGIYAFNRSGKLLWQSNVRTKLQNNTILGMHCDPMNNVWLTLDNGISLIYNNSTLLFYIPILPQLGMVYDYAERDGQSYLATNQGLYCYDRQQHLRIVDGLTEQTWTIGNFDNNLICGHNRGLFAIEGEHAKSLSSVGSGATCVRWVKTKSDDFLLQSSYTTFNSYKKNPSGRWEHRHVIANFVQLIRSFEVDHLENVWAEHMHKGLYRFRLSKDLDSAMDIRYFNALQGTKDAKISVFKIGGRIVFSDRNRFYTYEDIQDTIIPYTLLNEQLPDLTDTYKVVEFDGTRYWFVSNQYYSLVKFEKNTFSILYQIPLLLDYAPIEGNGNVFADPKQQCSYLMLNGGIMKLIHPQAPQPPQPPLYFHQLYAVTMGMMDKGRQQDGPKFFFDRIYATNVQSDTLILLEPNQKAVISYSFNNLNIILATSFFNKNEHSVMYMLEGLPGSQFQKTNSFQIEFNRLPYGEYTFKAYLVNLRGEVLDRHSFFFMVKRPIYLSFWAYLIYALLIVGLLFVVANYVNRRKSRLLEVQKRRYNMALETQEKRFVELQKEQLEEEVKQKSKELSTIAMINIANRELLVAVKDELLRQKSEGLFTRQHLESVISMIEGNIKSSTGDWELFQNNFDRVHENFFNRLKAEYPNLTSTDLRLCAYIRLNLSTKDISKLMNISLRGVEAGRYRLRKKFDIEPEQSLTDFIMRYK